MIDILAGPRKKFAFLSRWKDFNKILDKVGAADKVDKVNMVKRVDSAER